MDVSNLLSHDPPPAPNPSSTPASTQQNQQRAHQYPTRQSMSATVQNLFNEPNSSISHNQVYNGGLQDDRPGYDPSIATASLPKNVAFELLFDGPNTRARLPMRVQIFPHDTTDSILTTVKNFYGLYDGAATGVSFEDEEGNTLIARYENLRNNMIVYVRVVQDYPHGPFQHSTPSFSPTRAPRLDEAFQMPPPAQLSHHNAHDPISRPGSRVARKRSASPRASRNHRSVSAQKNRSRSRIKSRDTSLPRSMEEPHSDAMNFYSDSDGGAGSVTSSRKARSEQLASAEISVDNIVEGGRRKRAKFESSAFGILPTPDPTVASCISDEDVALQLMRLGDASNISHGRTSASTLDDALSGRAEIASSASSDEDDESEDAGQSSLRLPRVQTGCESTATLAAHTTKSHSNLAQSGLPISDHTHRSDGDVDGEYQFDERKDGLFKSDPDDIVNEYEQAVGARAALNKPNHARTSAFPKKLSKPSKHRSGTSHKKSKVSPVPLGSKVPLSPASVVPQSRKTSSASTLNFQHHLGADEEDLSSKPRCQRCRKSKKGCDRQRPCQRCRDAGIGIEGCVSEDEGNGRKGRFGRHMGVSVKKDGSAAVESEIPDPILHGMASTLDKSKKRKR
ncbi:MAG: hypothetical protein Q9166_000482 [cf. Caloplaca sp. 2 TL-2023]